MPAVQPKCSVPNVEKKKQRRKSRQVVKGDGKDKKGNWILVIVISIHRPLY
jgi:hypothetical protein